MAGSVDPKLVAQLRAAAAGDVVQAAIVVAKGPRAAAAPAGQPSLMERVAAQVGEEPHQVIRLDRLGVTIVHASPRFIAALLDQDEVESASATGASA